ncbi:MAG: trypsin-like serine protease, partial [Planctomycetota bacterium]
MRTPVESLEHRRLLSGYTEYHADGSVTRGGGESDALDAVLTRSLKANGFDGLGDLLDSLGSPSTFLREVGAAESSSKVQESLGFDPSGTAAETGVVRSVESPDDRVRVTDTTSFPFSAVGRTDRGCSGAMISPFHFLTAGHCVTSGSSIRDFSQLGVSLGQNGSARPFGTAEPVTVRVYDDWRFFADWEDDWAVITLDRSVGDFAGYFGYRRYAQTNALDGRPATILQYPGDKPFGTQWTASGPIGFADDQKIFYNGTLDTAGGS